MLARRAGPCTPKFASGDRWHHRPSPQRENSHDTTHWHGLRLAGLDGPRGALKRAQIADDVGIDSIWVAEAWGQDAFTTMVQLVERTKNVQVGTGIVNIYSRTPAALAQHFATIDELSEGRVIVGLGNSGPQVIEHFHGVPFQPAFKRMRETVEIMKILFAGERLNYNGDIFKLQRGFTLRFETYRKQLPIYLATLNPQIGANDRRNLRRLAADHDPDGPAQARDRPDPRLGARGGQGPGRLHRPRSRRRHRGQHP